MQKQALSLLIRLFLHYFSRRLNCYDMCVDPRVDREKNLPEYNKGFIKVKNMDKLMDLIMSPNPNKPNFNNQNQEENNDR